MQIERKDLPSGKWFVDSMEELAQTEICQNMDQYLKKRQCNEEENP